MQWKSTLFLTGVEIKQTKLGNFFVVIPELLVQLLIALFGQPGVMQKNVSYCISEKKDKDTIEKFVMEICALSFSVGFVTGKQLWRLL